MALSAFIQSRVTLSNLHAYFYARHFQNSGPLKKFRARYQRYPQDPPLNGPAWKRPVEESVKKVGLKIEEAADRTR